MTGANIKIDVQQIKFELSKVNELFKQITSLVEPDKVRMIVEELEKSSSVGGFWDDATAASKVMNRLKNHKKKLERFEKTQQSISDLNYALEFFQETGDEEFSQELTINIPRISQELEQYQLEMLLNEKYDANGAIVSIHPGAGGTESQDWAQMLVRMYLRWCENKGYEVVILDQQPGDEAGIKSVTFVVRALNGYGFLKGERGVHRLVRISPFDSNKRRHTSFASVDVSPEIEDDDQDIEINEKDLRIDTYRSSGAGGQHVNVTDSAVRITHLPTGVVTQCQNERSQHANRDSAMRVLKSKLALLKEQEKLKEIEDLGGIKRDIAWGSQLRSYVFCPYTMVKDHRCQVETGNVDAVINGEIDLFIYGYLRWSSLQTTSSKA